jgi:hypothetical protein
VREYTKTENLAMVVEDEPESVMRSLNAAEALQDMRESQDAQRTLGSWKAVVTRWMQEEYEAYRWDRS